MKRSKRPISRAKVRASRTPGQGAVQPLDGQAWKDRSTLVNTLRGFGVFRNASLRLLSDLVERDSAFHVPTGFGKFVDLAKRASFSLYQSLDLKHWDEQWQEGRPAAHLIWVCERPELKAPLEALTQLLAASIARDFGEPTAIVTFSEAGPRLAVWEEGRFTPKGKGRPTFKTQEEIIHALQAGGDAKPFHLFFIQPADPGDVRTFKGKGFHRIVYVTDKAPQRLPDGLEALLVSDARPRSADDDPYFCSFIPSVIAKGPQHDRSPVSAFASSRASLLRPVAETFGIKTGFETRRVDDEFQQQRKIPVRGRRLRRDRCCLRFDLPYLSQHWDEWNKKGAGRRTSFPQAMFQTQPAYQETASRWGRAVTNRQVGLALSGGGASSYKLVPLIHMLHASNVPLDVVGGVSGGALIGAYYCHSGLTGLRTCVEQGMLFGAFVAGAVMNSKSIQVKVDWDLGSSRVEDLEVRFVPLTTALHASWPPEGCVVISGTLGEAVRASGSAPLGFGRTRINGTRYADGATASLIPARAVKDYGADFVVACNSIPGPQTGNPLTALKRWPLLQQAGELAVNCIPLVGRVIDLGVSAAYLVQEASREVAQDAHVYIEAGPQVIPFMESFEFWRAEEFASEDLLTTAVLQIKAQECQQRWTEFKK
jgi:predicted acylesterase/phospholipase RssA